jgi:maleylpyruvate isomerase
MTDRAEETADTVRRIDEATSRLMATVHGLTEDDVRRASLLPGWTVGHVLTHIARNADSLVNLATWARTGVETPQYASQDARDSDIEAGAGRPLAELAADVADSAERLRGALARMEPEHYEVDVQWRGGAWKSAAVIPAARLTEVEIHHADLGLGFGYGDIPEPLRLLLLADAVEGWDDADGVVVQAEDLQLTLPEGREPKVLVSGSSGDLLGWAGGRTSGENLRCDGPLPAVPEWR